LPPRLTQPVFNEFVPLPGKDWRSRNQHGENVILLVDASMIKDHSDVKEEGEGRRLS
jgi:hypothetical protein